MKLKDVLAAFSISYWIFLMVGLAILLIVVGNLLPTVTDALTTYNAEDPTFGPVLVVIVPILIGAGILMAVVAAIFRSRGKKGGM